jgi:steroid delta-isomerase-like uncharacterized protein
VSGNRTSSGGPGSWAADHLDAWTAHDPVAVTAFMADDVVYRDLAVEERLEGTAAVQDWIRGMETDFSTDYAFQIGAVVADDQGYAIEWTMSGTNDRADPQRGFPATGQRFDVPGVSVGRLSAGRITENRDYWNLGTYLGQVGLMPAPEPAATAGVAEG